jgi:tetratricopeptide (TPR) repeat protein
VPDSVEFALLDELASAVSTEVVGALELLATPHWLDDQLAISIVTEFGQANGTTPQVVARIHQLPFISPHGTNAWRLVGSARAYFLNRVEQKRELFVSLNNYLAEYFRSTSTTFVNQEHPLAREAVWRSVYHETPASPKSALADLETLVDRAATTERLSDMKAAVQLTEAQRPWLEGYDAEVAYIVGRYAYARRDLELAEDRFLIVWRQDVDAHRRIVAGHLLGVIWSGRSREPWWSHAESTLTEAADLAHHAHDYWGRAMILTSLGSLLTKMGGAARLEEAETVLRQSVSLHRDIGSTEIGLTLSALGAVLAKRGGRARLIEAEELLRTSYSVLPSEARRSVVDRLARVLIGLGDSARLEEAEALLRDRLSTATDDLDRAVTLNTLAGVLLKRGTPAALTQAEEAVQASIEAGRLARNGRHVAIALLNASWIAERRGDIALAISRQEEMIETNRRLGLRDEIVRAQERLGALRRQASSD